MARPIRRGAPVRQNPPMELEGSSRHLLPLDRAVAAQLGIYGNSPEEATYPLTLTDIDGQPLGGSKHAYTLTFIG